MYAKPKQRVTKAKKTKQKKVEKCKIGIPILTIIQTLILLTMLTISLI